MRAIRMAALGALIGVAACAGPSRTTPARACLVAAPAGFPDQPLEMSVQDRAAATHGSEGTPKAAHGACVGFDCRVAGPARIALTPRGQAEKLFFVPAGFAARTTLTRSGRPVCRMAEGAGEEGLEIVVGGLKVGPVRR